MLLDLLLDLMFSDILALLSLSGIIVGVVFAFWLAEQFRKFNRPAPVLPTPVPTDIDLIGQHRNKEKSSTDSEIILSCLEERFKEWDERFNSFIHGLEKTKQPEVTQPGLSTEELSLINKQLSELNNTLEDLRSTVARLFAQQEGHLLKIEEKLQQLQQIIGSLGEG